MVHLDVSMTSAAASFVDADLSQYLAGPERGRHQVDEKIVYADRALAIFAGDDKFGVERNHRCGPIACRIRVGHAAANRPLISYLHVANVAGAFRHQRAAILEKLKRVNLLISSRTADA